MAKNDFIYDIGYYDENGPKGFGSRSWTEYASYRSQAPVTRWLHNWRHMGSESLMVRVTYRQPMGERWYLPLELGHLNRDEWLDKGKRQQFLSERLKLVA